MVRPARRRTFRSRAGSRLARAAARRTRPRRGRTDPAGPAAHKRAAPARRIARLPAAHRRSTCDVNWHGRTTCRARKLRRVAALARTGDEHVGRGFLSHAAPSLRDPPQCLSKIEPSYTFDVSSIAADELTSSRVRSNVRALMHRYESPARCLRKQSRLGQPRISTPEPRRPRRHASRTILATDGTPLPVMTKSR